MILSHIYNECPPADVCIVGAGPVGLATALRLEAQGLTVTLLEMGSEGSLTQERGGIKFSNLHHASVDSMSRPGIGGGSALWGGRCVALDDLDFDPRTHVAHSGWPIPHDEIRRYYAPALEFLRCGTSPLRPEEMAAGDADVTAAAIERWSEQPDLGPIYRENLRLSDRITLLTGAVASAIELDASGQRVERLRVRMGEKEIEVGAKEFVLAGGGLENARLLLGLENTETSVAKPMPAATGQFYQGHLTGYVAVLHLNRPSSAAALFFHKDREGKIFRQRFQISPSVQLEEKLLNTVFWIDAMSIADPTHGSGALSFCYLSLTLTSLYDRLSEGLAPIARSGVGRRLRQHLLNLVRDWTWPRDLPAVFKTLRRKHPRRYTLFNPSGRYLLRYHAEQVPDPRSRVVLAPSGADAGQVLAVDYRVTDQDIDSVMRSHETLDAWLRRNDIGRLEYLVDGEERAQSVFRQAFDGYHQIGLTRMSADPAHGTADPDCRVHGVENLYLAGSCLFPTGGHANPTLPAVALSMRLADHLGTRLARR
jgi:choline dehydrogenase-like flavoprotein